MVKARAFGYELARQRTKTRQIARADELCSRYLADANEALEAGKIKKAEKLYEKSGFWRDRYNELAGNN